MGKILAFSGKKQSGKNTSTNYIVGSLMTTTGLISHCNMTDHGELIVPFGPETEGGEPVEGIFDPLSRHEELQNWMAENLWHIVKVYSFADKLKEFAIECLGLTDAQCYGTDEDKNTIVPHLLWENMPGVITGYDDKSIRPAIDKIVSEVLEGRLGPYYIKNGDIIYHKPGPMTARELLQFFGTEIGRKMYGNIWVDATIRQIQKDQPLLALICDTRFINEVEGVQKAGGKVIRFTRNKNTEDAHTSETALDVDKFDWSRFDAIIDNIDMSISDQNDAVIRKLIEWGWFDIAQPANTN